LSFVAKRRRFIEAGTLWLAGATRPPVTKLISKQSYSFGEALKGK
jgi:hypothetical protein